MDIISQLEKIINGGKILPDYLDIKVSIIGAGLSGLFCGWILSHLGFKVKIHEASDRLGGRVYTVPNDIRLIEAGGELIGINHPIWLFLAKYFCLGLSSITPDSNYTGMKLYESMIIDNKTLTHEEIQNINEQIQRVYNKISRDASKLSFPDQPWNESDEIQAMDKISIKDKLDEWNISGDVRALIEFIFSNDNVSDIARQSYLGLLCQVKGGSIDGDTKTFWDAVEVFRCSNGNHSLAYALSETLDIDTCDEITSVNYEKDHINYVINDTYNDLIHNATCDFMVVTAPPTVWDKIKFDDTLDLSMYTPDMGPAMKIIFNVYNRFWMKQGLSPNIISTNIGQTWEPTENQTIPYSSKNQKIFLTVFSGGPQFAKIKESYDMYDCPFFAAELCKIKNLHDITKIPLFNDKLADEVVKTEIFDWTKIPHIRTGYSYIGLGKATSVGKYLYNPVPSYGNRLIFAGEHTCMNFAGFMEGALQSGLRAALKIKEQVQSKYF